MIDYIVRNGDALLSVATTVVAAASAIAALTPSPKDDGIVRVLRRLIELLALNVGNARSDR
ncbi:hypothetical protein L2U69_12480 [Zavarzinia compransoris]|uniref:hypothetical protein n=1 Tax=Zavarzinia marina TaxID=2911065 RepID=UPI001F167EB1|nr:hypothetical protein [Zavarzinia marina]MCF4166462.1 hypothetical protein [Zavarzinia marina]